MNLVRTVKPDKKPATSGDFQSWFRKNQEFRWDQARKITKRLAAGDIDAEEWADAFDAILLEGHSNAWWIGRTMAGKDGEFGDDDLLAGRGYKDVENDFLKEFLADIQEGRYDDENGDLDPNLINVRSRLYIGKMMGTVNDAWVQESDEDALWYWRLGGVEEHCEDCPILAEEFSGGDTRDTLFTTPGAGDTPCLGNCKCYLERRVASVWMTGVKRVDLELNSDEEAS